MPRLLPLLLVLALLSSACGQAFGDPAVAAVINDEEIPISRLEPLVADSAGAADPTTGEPQSERQATTQVLSELSLLTLLGQELERLGGERVDEAAVDQQVEQAQTDAGGEEAFAAQLQAQGLTPNRVRLDLAFQTTIDRLIAQLSEDFEVTEEEVQFRYGTAYGLPTVSHILVETEEEAQQVRARLEAGESFEAIAMEVSIDPGSGAQGGSLGPLQIGAFVPEFEEAALALQPGEISDPVQTQFGYHIITTAAPQELDEALREQITTELRDEGVQGSLGALLNRLLEEAEVQVNPRFGRWDPAFSANGGLSQIISASDPLGALQPVGGLEGLTAPPGQAPPGQAPPPGAPPGQAPPPEAAPPAEAAPADQ